MALTDDFNRSDNASSIGSPSDGGAAYVTSGTWGISSNAAYKPGTASHNYAIRPINGGSTSNDAYAKATVTTSGDFNSAALCLTDSSGGSGYVFFLNLFAAQTELWKVDNAGGFTRINYLGYSVTSGDVMTLEKVGSTLKTYQNGTLKSTDTDSTYSTVTHAGLYAYADNTGVRYDDLEVGTTIGGGAASLPILRRAHRGLIMR